MAKTHSFIQRIKLIDIENIAPHACFACSMIHRRNIDYTKIVKIFHQHLQHQQCCDVRECHAKHFVRNHRNDVQQCIETGTNRFNIDIFHAIKEHVRNTNTAEIIAKHILIKNSFNFLIFVYGFFLQKSKQRKKQKKEK